MPQAETGRPSRKRIILLIATGLVLIFIFAQSLLPQNVSAEESGWITEKIINPFLNLFGLRSMMHGTVRKLVHIAEFAILSVLLVFCFRGKPIKGAGAGFTAAFLDESIQLLSDRGALISDVWIDLIGVALGSLLGFLVYRAIIRRRQAS